MSLEQQTPTPFQVSQPTSPPPCWKRAPVLIACGSMLGIVIGSIVGYFIRPVLEPSSGDWSSRIRCEPELTVSTPADYEIKFLERINPDDVLRGPPCADDHLLGIVHFWPYYKTSKGLEKHIQPYQFGKRIAFAVGSRTLEQFLVFGKNGGRRILDSLAMGELDVGFAYLLVWRQDYAGEKPDPIPGYWEHLGQFLRDVYKDALPDIEEAIAVIKNSSFKELTGCDASKLHAKSTPQYKEAGCNPIFIKAANETFPRNKPCNLPEKQFGSFSTKCEQEQRFLSLKKPSAIELRAMLFSNNDFNGYFTGYGYTAEDYGIPLAREYWLHNIPLKDLPDDEKSPWRDISFEVRSKTHGFSA